ncbi:hypothetical protein [Halorhabdus rudnickae]|uniref:hypothetical protein n=1 Tax=Halorhabdus rudnickae TaxID=1775544 RepID=UPI001083274E|nr:hypothetical protein [Halorhabdus rudnickae]
MSVTQSNSVSFEEYPFDQGDEVFADWREGMSSEDVIHGEIEEIHRSAGEVVVQVVDHENEHFAGGKTYDAAPEWILTPAVEPDD